MFDFRGVGVLFSQQIYMELEPRFFWIKIWVKFIIYSDLKTRVEKTTSMGLNTVKPWVDKYIYIYTQYLPFEIFFCHFRTMIMGSKRNGKT